MSPEQIRQTQMRTTLRNLSEELKAFAHTATLQSISNPTEDAVLWAVRKLQAIQDSLLGEVRAK